MKSCTKTLQNEKGMKGSCYMKWDSITPLSAVFYGTLFDFCWNTYIRKTCHRFYLSTYLQLPCQTISEHDNYYLEILELINSNLHFSPPRYLTLMEINFAYAWITSFGSCIELHLVGDSSFHCNPSITLFTGFDHSEGPLGSIRRICDVLEELGVNFLDRTPRTFEGNFIAQTEMRRVLDINLRRKRKFRTWCMIT